MQIIYLDVNLLDVLQTLFSFLAAEATLSSFLSINKHATDIERIIRIQNLRESTIDSKNFADITIFLRMLRLQEWKLAW